MLVGMLKSAPDKLRADFQRFYGLNLDDVGISIRPRRAADLAANLPENARIWRALNPQAEWTTSQHLLANIADNTSFLAWTKTKDSQKSGARWRGSLPRPGTAPRNQTHGEAFTVDELQNRLNQPRQ